MHALLVGTLVFLMLMIGTRKYGVWSFCRTAIAIAFNLGAHGDAIDIAASRVILTIGGIAFAVLVVPLPPGPTEDWPASRRVPGHLFWRVASKKQSPLFLPEATA